jgi:hypothetical protein
MIIRVARWLIFTVVISLLPFIMIDISLWSHGKLEEVFAFWRHGDVLWPRGEVLLVATAIGADAMGGLIASNSANDTIRLFKITTAGGCFLLTLGAAWWYANIQDSLPTLLGPREVTGSGYVLVATIVVSLICKALAED